MFLTGNTGNNNSLIRQNNSLQQNNNNLPPPRNNNTSLIQQNNNINNRTLWTDSQIVLLINERRRLNFEFHYQAPRSHANLWARIAGTINRVFNSNYNGNQCKNKFHNLVSDYNVSKNK
jgi:hypothetical protein